MIEIDDKKKKSRLQKDRELKNIFRIQMIFSYGLVFVTRISKILDHKEILVIGIIGYLIISAININKADEIKRS
jgi:hypothetical protein